MRTIGGSLSNEDFGARLIDECRNTHWSFPLNWAAASLYRKLEAKGL
jgi:hypothetical protein